MSIDKRLTLLENDILPRGAMLDFRRLPKDERIKKHHELSEHFAAMSDDDLEIILSDMPPDRRRLLSEISDGDLLNFCIGEVAEISANGRKQFKLLGMTL